MKVTSINSTTSDFVLDVIPAYTAGWTFLQIGRAGINVKTADLLAALDATANTDVAGMRRDLIVAENAADEWKARAEKAESTLSRIEDVRHDFYEIRGDWADPEGAAALKAQMERAILGDPPFTLPTGAGARFEARMKQDPDEWRTFITFDGGVNGALYSYFDAKYGWYTYDEDDVLAQFTDHRLLGAES